MQTNQYVDDYGGGSQIWGFVSFLKTVEYCLGFFVFKVEFYMIMASFLILGDFESPEGQVLIGQYILNHGR